MTSRQSLSDRIAARGAVVGLLQSQPNLTLTEMAQLCGYDFLMFDGEHGLFSEMDYQDALQVLGTGDLIAFVRLAGHQVHAVGRYLDIGADVIVVPNVSTADEAALMSRAMVYPPYGTRGVGAPLHRGIRYGMDLAGHLKEPRGHASLLVIVESKIGTNNAAQILAVPGVDGVIVGPSDLSADLGCAGDFSHPAYLDAVARIEEAALKAGKLLATAPHPGHSLESLMARGYRCFIVGADTALLREAMSMQVEQSRARLSILTHSGNEE